MKYIFTSDWHIAHKNILKFAEREGCQNLDEMHHKLITNYNAVADENTVGYFLGDIAFDYKIAKEVIGQLKGVRVLIRGNHDYKPGTMIKMGFHVCMEEAVIKRLGQYIKLSHYPYQPLPVPLWRQVLLREKARKVRYLSKRPIDNGGWLLHGHTHSSEKICNKMIHVGVDAWKMKPVTEQQLESLIGKYKNT